MNESHGPVRTVEDGVVVEVWVVPGSRRPGLDGLHDGRVRVRVAAPPEGGRANREAAATLAGAIGGRRGRVIRGAGARRKAIEVDGVGAAAAITRLRAAGVAV